MKKLKGYYSKAKPYKQYMVYGRTFWGTTYIGNTYAKSEAQAVNNVRYRTYGLELTNAPFYAEEVIDENSDTSDYHWYVVEYCGMNGEEQYFYQPWACYAVIYAKDADSAKRKVRNEWFYESEYTYRDTSFGRVQEFDNESLARQCAKEWELKNEEVYKI